MKISTKLLIALIGCMLAIVVLVLNERPFWAIVFVFLCMVLVSYFRDALNHDARMEQREK